MKAYCAIFLLSLVFLTSCGDEDPPKLETGGHWVIAHGFFDDVCRVGATFTEELLILTFRGLEPDACAPELFGINGNSLPIEVVSREDFLDESGVMAARMDLAIPDRGVEGIALLSETSQGMEGIIEELYEPNFAESDLLLMPTYEFSRVPDDWFDLAKGNWGAPCTLDNEDLSQDLCSSIEFVSPTKGHIFGSEAALRNGDSGPSDITFALENVEGLDDGGYKLWATIYFDDASELPTPAMFEFSQSTARVKLYGSGDIVLDVDLVRLSNARP